MSELLQAVGEFFFQLVLEGLEFLFSRDREVRHAAIGCYTMLAILLVGVVVCGIFWGRG